MFSDIEKEYKKGLQERRFVAFYWPKAIFIALLAILGDLLFHFDRWLVYGFSVAILLGLVVYFFVRDLRMASRSNPAMRAGKGISTKLDAYFAADDAYRIDNLLSDLARHGIHTKQDLELTLDFFQTRLPASSKPNFLEWTLTAVIALSSIIIVTYDDVIDAIDIHKLISALGSTLVIALIFLTPFIIARIISALISSSRNKVETALVEDLAYIYFHFDQYNAKLTKTAKTSRSQNHP